MMQGALADINEAKNGRKSSQPKKEIPIDNNSCYELVIDPKRIRQKY